MVTIFKMNHCMVMHGLQALLTFDEFYQRTTHFVILMPYVIFQITFVAFLCLQEQLHADMWGD